MAERGHVCRALFALFIMGTASGCGLHTPDKDPFISDAPIGPDYKFTRQGGYESGLVDHITCEISRGLAASVEQCHLKWLQNGWGTAVILIITVEDPTGLWPGISTIAPFPNVVFPFPTGVNVTSPPSFSTSLGGTASANALRTETIQFTFRNSEAIDRKECGNTGSGILIDGDLKIREFIYDKAQIIYGANGLWEHDRAPFNAWTEEITFVAAYGGSATPTWKLARLSANTSSNLVVSERTNTNDLVITLGPLQADPKPVLK